MINLNLEIPLNTVFPNSAEEERFKTEFLKIAESVTLVLSDYIQHAMISTDICTKIALEKYFKKIECAKLLKYDIEKIINTAVSNMQDTIANYKVSH